MNRTAPKLVSSLAYAATVTAAALAVTLISSAAWAETPTVDDTPFVSTRTRAEVRAEVLSQRSSLSAAAGEWATYLPQLYPRPATGSVTREQLKAQYIAERDRVKAMNGEDSGSAFIAQNRARAGGTQVAGQGPRGGAAGAEVLSNR
jgi:hypothetical protein